MAARKTTPKTTRKTASKAAGAKQASARKVAKKVTKKPASKASAAKPAARKTAAAAKPKPAAGKRAATPEPTPKAKPARTGSGASSMDVNLGHVFALRPPVSKTFRQADFLTARHLLQDESFEDREKAARAVAEKALDLTRHGPSKRGDKRGRERR